MPDQSKQKPWESDWKIIQTIGGGGQGSTYLVESTNQQQRACLKVLTDNGSKERRERFRRECVALETLNHRRIPHFLCSNSNEFQGSARLYLVSEFIEGVTLDKYLEKGMPDPTT